MNSQIGNEILENSISIVYEDEDVLAVNKPSGLMTHPDGRNESRTLSDWAVEYSPEIRGVGEPLKLSNGSLIERHGIVHRLDRETSGIILLAKHQKAFEYLKIEFQERRIQKTYYAFVHGILPEPQGSITLPIGKSRSKFPLWSAERGARGMMRDAITAYRVIESSKEFSFVEVLPKTGRTHQIRVHFKAIQHPIVCDKLYAPKRPCALGFKRLALHALSLEFTLPSGVRVKLETAPPSDFLKARALLASGQTV